MNNTELSKKISKIHEMSLRSIIENYGGIFINNSRFSHSYFCEKTPSCSIYIKGNKEYWKCFGRNLGGDAIDFVSLVTGYSKTKAINLIYYHSYPKSNINIRHINIEEDKKKNKKRMYGIIKNSVNFIESTEAKEYFRNRKILNEALQLNDRKIKILFNSYSSSSGKLKRIVYRFIGKQDEYLLLKNINKENGTRFKMNLGIMRPVFHIEDTKKPVIICEGIEDCLSAKALGYRNFISLNSTNMINKLLILMLHFEHWFAKYKFEICFDNDAAGQECLDRLRSFSLLGNVINDLSSKYDDINILLKNRKVSMLNDSEILSLVNLIYKKKYFLNYKGFGEKFNISESYLMKKIKDEELNDLNDYLNK